MSTLAVSQEVERSRQQEKIAMAKENKVEVAIFELVDTQPSGFVKEGTDKLPEPIELGFAGVRRILTRSAIIDPKTKKRVVTRHILGQEEYRAHLQDADLMNPELDDIAFVNGRIVATNEGREASRYYFMKYGDSRNETNPYRIPGTDAVYREVFPEKEVEADNGMTFDLAEAIVYIRERVVLRQGKNGVEYNSEALDTMCRLFNVGGENDGAKVANLISVAGSNPVEFYQKAQQFEQAVYTEIAHGEELGLIAFGETEVSYVGKNKILITYSKQLSKQNKVKQLANHFMSADGAFDYKEYLIELDNKKNENI